MTTDPFNTTDAYFDEMPHHLADYCEHAGVGKACRRCRRKFDAASQWARTHLAAQEGHRRVRKYADDWDTCTCGYDAWPCRSQEPTDAEVEAAARELAERESPTYGAREWDETPPNFPRKQEWRLAARAALSAARAVRRDEEKR